MAGEWRSATVVDIAASTRNALVGGPFGSNLVSRDYADHGVPVIRGQNMGGRWVSGEFVFVTKEKAKSLEANLARPGDIVFTQRGTLGQVSLIPDAPFDRYLVSQSQMKLTVDRNVADPRFFYYVFTSAQQQDYVRQHAIQTGVPHTNLGILRATPVPFPPLNQQRAIAHILGTLDDKIELNRRMSETLEAMAQALFKSWFVDFDPVYAKAESCDPGLPQHLADLFPARLVDSELGEIPEGWISGTLGDVLLQRIERCAPSDEIQSKPYVPIECIAARSLLLADSKPGDDAQSSLTKFYEGDLLFGAMRPYFHKVCIAPFDGTTRTTVFVLTPRHTTDFAFATLAVHNPTTIDYATSHSTGSTIPYAVWAGSLESMPLLLPPPRVRASFNSLVRPLLSRIPPLFFENRTLAALRDTLLPKLISGELRVQDAERFIEGLSDG